MHPARRRQSGRTLRFLHDLNRFGGNYQSLQRKNSHFQTGSLGLDGPLQNRRVQDASLQLHTIQHSFVGRTYLIEVAFRRNEDEVNETVLLAAVG